MVYVFKVSAKPEVAMMNTITVYIDESLSTREMLRLKKEIMTLPHVVDVEHPRHDKHDLTIDYEPAVCIPQQILQWLRAKGLHPDITSAW